MKPYIALPVVAVMLCAALAACGEDKPAVCDSVDSLKSSIEDIKNIDITSSTAVGELEAGLTTIEGDISDVKTDAKSEFSTQLSAVDTALAALKTAYNAAKADPSAATLAAVGTAVAPLNDALKTLISDVKSTC